jgi:hypothetical protein
MYRSISRLLIIVTFIIAIVLVAVPVQRANARPLEKRSATIKTIWVDRNVSEKGQTGMRIHVAFDIEDAQAADCSVHAYFEFANGIPLRDVDGLYRTSDGKVSVWKSFEPKYESSTWSDFKLFMPYKQLHVKPNTDLRLQFVTQIRCKYSPYALDSMPYSFTVNLR